MNENSDKINNLLRKLELLQEKQDNFSDVIRNLKDEILSLKRELENEEIEDDVEVDFSSMELVMIL